MFRTLHGLGRSPGGEHGNPLQYSCLENSMDRGAWRATVHRVAQSRTGRKRLSSSSRLQSVQFSGSEVSDSLRPHGLHAAHQASLSITNSWSLLKLMSIESVMPSNHLILSRPLLFLPSIFPTSGSFPMSQLFPSGGQSIGASASVLPMDIQD